MSLPVEEYFVHENKEEVSDGKEWIYHNGEYPEYKGGLEYLVANPPKVRPKKQMYIDDESIGKCKTLMETLSSGMEITCTFSDKLINAHTSDTLTRILRDTLLRVRGVHYFKMLLIGEFSKIGRYHMHGMVYTDGRGIEAIKRKLGRDIGFCHCKQISFTDSYIKYIFKSDYEDLPRNIRIQEIINITDSPLPLTTIRR